MKEPSPNHFIKAFNIVYLKQLCNSNVEQFKYEINDLITPQNLLQILDKSYKLIDNKDFHQCIFDHLRPTNLLVLFHLTFVHSHATAQTTYKLYDESCKSKYRYRFLSDIAADITSRNNWHLLNLKTILDTFSNTCTINQTIDYILSYCTSPSSVLLRYYRECTVDKSVFYKIIDHLVDTNRIHLIEDLLKRNNPELEAYIKEITLDESVGVSTKFFLSNLVVHPVSDEENFAIEKVSFGIFYKMNVLTTEHRKKMSCLIDMKAQRLTFQS